VVAAPDKFKGTLTAAQAAARIAAGLTAARPGLAVEQVPVADGGDGTVAAALAAGYRPVPMTVRGPTGQPVRAEFAWRDGTAIIEAAQACGLTRLPGGQPRPLTATSFGVGELVAAALARGAQRIVLGLGGVASSDGGAGLVQALGGRLLDQAGRELPPGGAALTGLHRLDLAGLAPLRDTEVLLASDVDNPLLGEHGAAAVYGPQKGATPADVIALEAGLTRWADCAERPAAPWPGQPSLGPGRPGPDPGTPGPGRSQSGFWQPGCGPGHPGRGRQRDRLGAGAAGGLGFAAFAFLGARARPGIELILELISFPARLAGAWLVVTGEGSLDEQTLRGKAPAGVARAARAGAAAAGSGAAGAAGPRLPVVAVAGRCTLPATRLREAGLDAAYPLTDLEPDLARCRADAGPLLERAARRIAGDWLPAGAPGPGGTPGTLAAP
jgi:glycerate kinase